MAPSTPTFPFLTRLLRVFPQEAVTIIAHDNTGEPSAVCVRTESAADCAIALSLLKDHPDSFVLYQKREHRWRCESSGVVLSYDPIQPRWAGELHLSFDMEWVRLGPRPWIYVFTHSQAEWEAARQAMRHLLQSVRLSPRSYIEGVNSQTGKEQGAQAFDLDAEPHGPGLVAQFREVAIRVQNTLVVSRSAPKSGVWRLADRPGSPSDCRV